MGRWATWPPLQTTVLCCVSAEETFTGSTAPGRLHDPDVMPNQPTIRCTRGIPRSSVVAQASSSGQLRVTWEAALIGSVFDAPQDGATSQTAWTLSVSVRRGVTACIGTPTCGSSDPSRPLATAQSLSAGNPDVGRNVGRCAPSRQKLRCFNNL